MHSSDSLLYPILNLSFVDSLPLHIGPGVPSAALEGDHMVDDVAGTWAFRLLGGGAEMLVVRF